MRSSKLSHITILLLIASWPFVSWVSSTQWQILLPFFSDLNCLMRKPTKWLCTAKTHPDPPSLIRVFAVRSVGSSGPKLSSCRQRMPRLIWIFAGRIYHFVNFVKKRLISVSSVSYIWAPSSENVSSKVCDRVTFKPACSATEAS